MRILRLLADRSLRQELAELRAKLRVAELERDKLQFVCARDLARVRTEASGHARQEAQNKVAK